VVLAVQLQTRRGPFSLFCIALVAAVHSTRSARSYRRARWRQGGAGGGKVRLLFAKSFKASWVGVPVVEQQFGLGACKHVRLTHHSSGAPTACHTGHQAQGLRPILRLLPSASRRWRPLSFTLDRTKPTPGVPLAKFTRSASAGASQPCRRLQHLAIHTWRISHGHGRPTLRESISTRHRSLRRLQHL
jgi:hypothetical protein